MSILNEKYRFSFEDALQVYKTTIIVNPIVPVVYDYSSPMMCFGAPNFIIDKVAL